MRGTFRFALIVLVLALLGFTHLIAPLPTALAWDCSAAGYSFAVEIDGTVVVQNLSGLDEAAQSATVEIDGVAAGTFAVPAMPAHTGRTVIGHVVVPNGGAFVFSWSVTGNDDCRNEGRHDPKIPPTPPPTGERLVCVTIDKGDLWGSLTAYNSDASGTQGTAYDGRVEITHDAAIAFYPNPDQEAYGYFLVIDEHGTSALFYIEQGMKVNCQSPVNWGCIRIYAVQPVQDPCACTHKEN